MFIYSDYSVSEYTKIHVKLNFKKFMNEPIFNLILPIAISQQWLPPDVTNCMTLNFKN